MNRKRLGQLLSVAGALACTALFSSPVCSAAATAMQSYVASMQPGTNLGNTFDAIPDETSWGNPATTQTIIQQFAAQGYKSIRIPVTWSSHTGPAPTYTVDPAWMNRIQQVVDWSLQSGMKVMLNMHHDSWEWVSSLPTNHDAVIAEYTAVWSQISQRFANYPNTLMFEAINEPTFSGVDTATALKDLDELETVFFNVVRGSGGLNTTRPLVLTVLGGGATPDSVKSLATTVQHLNDANLITTFHYYSFWPFSVNIVGYTAFDQSVINDLTSTMDLVYTSFVAKGIPSVVGEFGVLAGNNIERGQYLIYHEFASQYARSKGMTHMFWDAGQFFNRTTFQFNEPDLRAIFQQTLAGRATTADSDLIFVNGTPADAVVHLNLNGNHFVSLSNGSTLLRPDVDYTIERGVLTIKASALSQYASGAYGEKTTLSVNVDSGPAWTLHVRYIGSVTLSTASGTTGGPLTIPAMMNGDVLATMEARHADGSPAGPANWTAFKNWGDFLPDYANNKITLTQNFFSGEPAGTINLTFYFWSGQKATYTLSIHQGVSAGGSDAVIYDDNLTSGWNNWSWASVNTGNTSPVHAGSNSISVDAGAWGAVFLGNTGGPLTGTTYHTLTFWANGGAVGGQQITISASTNWNFPSLSYTINSIPANTWTKYEVPLSALGVDADPNITSFTIMNTSGGTEPTFYLDDVHLSPAYASWLLFVDGAAAAPAPVPPSFAVKLHEVHRQGSAHQLVQVVDLINQSGHAVTGPINLVLKGLSTNTTVTNVSGYTGRVVPCGDPYVTVTTAGLAAGGKTSVTLTFSQPVPGGSDGEGNGVGDDGYNITFTPVVLSDGFLP